MAKSELERARLCRALPAFALVWACGTTPGGHAPSDAGPREAPTSFDAGVVIAPDGACPSTGAPVGCLSLTTVGAQLGAVAVDDRNVYWFAYDHTAAGGALIRRARAGGATATLALAAGGSLVSDGLDVYWGQLGVGILKVPSAGGVVSTLATAAMPVCVATDDTQVYWTDPQGAGSVMKVAKQGGAVTTLALAKDVGANPFALVVDDSGVYWVGSALLHVGKDGGTIDTLAAGAAMVSVGCQSLAKAGTTLYVASYGPDGILAAPVDGSRASSVAGSATNVGLPLAATVTDLYWFGYGPPLEVNRTPLDGGKTETLVEPLVNALESLAVASDGAVYWTSQYQLESLPE